MANSIHDGAVLPASVVPYVRRGVTVTTADDARSVRFETRWVTAPIEGEGALLLQRVLPHLNGSASLEQVARASGLDLEQVQHLVTPLYVEGFLGERSPVAIDSQLFLNHARATAHAWENPSPVQHSLADRRASLKLALGAMVEEWQFIRINPSHISAAIQAARDERTEQHWSKMLEVEYAHGSWLRTSLEKVFSPRELDEAHPLPSTVALSNFYRVIATRSPLGYALTLSLGESNSDMASQNSGVRDFQREAGVPPAVLEDFIRHDKVDEDADHLALSMQPFLWLDTVSERERRDVLKTAWDAVQSMAYLDREIFEYYSNPANPQLLTIDDLPPFSDATSPRAAEPKAQPRIQLRGKFALGARPE